jgi:hypothetical protein
MNTKFCDKSILALDLNQEIQSAYRIKQECKGLLTQIKQWREK